MTHSGNDGIPQHAAPEPQRYDVVSSGTVEPKTKAAGIGAGAGGVVAGAALWALDEAFWNGELPPDVPGPLSALVWLAVPAAVAFASSYMARHVNRPNPEGN